MGLIDNNNKEKIVDNIDTSLKYFFNTEFAGPSGSFKVRVNAQVVSDLLNIRNFVKGYTPETKKAPAPKKTGDK